MVVEWKFWWLIGIRFSVEVVVIIIIIIIVAVVVVLSVRIVFAFSILQTLPFTTGFYHFLSRTDL